MNKAIVILSFLAITWYAIPDTSWAHRHILGPLEGEGRSLIPTQQDEFIGPILRGEGLSQPAGQSAWDGIKLMHPDPHHLQGVEPHHSVPYRNFQSPDGAAVMFGWTFDRP